MRLIRGYTVIVHEVEHNGQSYRREQYSGGSYAWQWCIGESIENWYADGELEKAFCDSLGKEFDASKAM